VPSTNVLLEEGNMSSLFCAFYEVCEVPGSCGEFFFCQALEFLERPRWTKFHPLCRPSEGIVEESYFKARRKETVASST
jgi:hypothetical protein